MRLDRLARTRLAPNGCFSCTETNCSQIGSYDPTQVLEPRPKALVGCYEIGPCGLGNGNVDHVVDGVVVIPSRQLPRSVQMASVIGESDGQADQEGVRGIGGGSGP